MAQIEKHRSGMKRARLDQQDWKYFRPKKDKLKLPKEPQKLLAAIEEILEEVGKVVSFVAKHGGKHQTKNYLPNNYARRLVYQIFRHCAAMDGLTRPEFVKTLLELRAKKGGPIGSKTASAAQKNIVFLCYWCAFPDNLIGSTERSRAAKLLPQAKKHGVKPKYLVGHLLQHSSTKDQQILLVD